MRESFNLICLRLVLVCSFAALVWFLTAPLTEGQSVGIVQLSSSKAGAVKFSTSEYISVPGPGTSTPINLDFNGIAAPGILLQPSSTYCFQTIIWRGTGPVTLGYTNGPGGTDPGGALIGTLQLEPGEALTGDFLCQMRSGDSGTATSMFLALGPGQSAAEGYFACAGTVR